MAEEFQLCNAPLDAIFDRLKTAASDCISAHQLSDRRLVVRCRALEATEAIGTPEHRDYPILKGREHMVEAHFEGARGQAFADQFEHFEGTVDSLLALPCETSAQRAVFIAGLNAIYRRLGYCELTVHCRDDEPLECARRLREIVAPGTRVLLVGLQPRFLEQLAQFAVVRAVDLDPQNIGKEIAGVRIEPAGATDVAIAWSQRLLVTGSTIVNGSITTFLAAGRPVTFFGVTISAAARILGLDVFCHAPVR